MTKKMIEGKIAADPSVWFAELSVSHLDAFGISERICFHLLPFGHGLKLDKTRDYLIFDDFDAMFKLCFSRSQELMHSHP